MMYNVFGDLTRINVFVMYEFREDLRVNVNRFLEFVDGIVRHNG